MKPRMTEQFRKLVALRQCLENEAAAKCDPIPGFVLMPRRIDG